MIYCLFVVLSAILFLVFNVVMKKLLFSKIERGDATGVQIIRFCSLALIIGFMILPVALNNLIAPKLSYDSFENYLFWSEGYRTEGFPEAKCYFKIDCGYLYSLDDEMLSGIARETNDGKFKKDSVELSKEKSLEVDETTVNLEVFKNSEDDLRIFLFLEMGGIDYEASVNGQEAAVYYDSGHRHYKVCVLENQKSYSILCNGETFEF